MKLDIESVIKIYCVFTYTAQKADIAYQKDKNNKNVKI
jgi:hypothetical protein